MMKILRPFAFSFAILTLVACNSDAPPPRLQKQPLKRPSFEVAESTYRVSLSKSNLTLEQVAQRLDVAAIQWLDAGHSQLTDEDLSFLVSFHGLRSLNMDVSSKITDEGLEAIQNLKQLQELSLFYCPKLTGSGLAYLSNLSQLEKLNIGNNKGLDNANLVHLTSLTNLKTLKAQPFWQCTDEGLKHIAQLTTLENLEISSREITDAGLEHLGNIQSLKKLNLNTMLPTKDSKISAEGLRNIEAALPNCEVIHGNGH